MKGGQETKQWEREEQVDIHATTPTYRTHSLKQMNIYLQYMYVGTGQYKWTNIYTLVNTQPHEM